MSCWTSAGCSSPPWPAWRPRASPTKTLPICSAFSTRSAASSRPASSAIVEDTAFHGVLARATRNRVVVSIMATLNDLLVESRKLALKQKGRPGRSMQGHEAVVAALQRRDADAAAEAMRQHIDQIADLFGHSEK